ncbi:CBS domain-containing protein [Mesorhizobium sp. M0510]|uniref:CBS domain-containing protein n=1 Tax=Mesorhizobium sp. M0510 TaxID=2956954 RepID=UPI003338D149
MTLAYPDEYLEGLSDKLLMANVSHLPVVTREGLQLVGYVGWKDLMRVRSRKQAEERERSTLLGFGTRHRKKNDAVESL